jgi:urease accessory protein
MKTLLRISLTLIAVLPSLALAHSGHGEASLASGFGHPLGGYDHLLAMVAVGIWAAYLGGSARFWVPASFVLALLIGGAMGMAGLSLPAIEPMILASSVAIGLALALAGRVPTVLAAAGCGLFAVFHGLAHGLEMPANGSAFGYAAGFALATILLHLAGLASGALSQKLAGRKLERWAGAAIALLGASLSIA